MSELSVTRGPARGQRLALSEGKSYTVGSDPGSALQIGGLAEQQLVVKPLKGGGFGAKGIAGEFTHNGRETAAARLKDGDLIAIGETELRFGIPESAVSSNGESGRDRAPETSRSGTSFPRDKQLGGFRLLGALGKGGMGRVYRAEQISLGREVALKVLSKELTENPVFVARFVAEARAAARLHHPNVVQVFDVDNDGDTYFYSMELMAGGSVEDLLRERGKVPVEESIAIVADAAKGLGFAEELRIVHRDIKPDNLMIDQHGHIKLADLGLALTEEDQGGKIVGTPHFMSPEQALRKPLDHRSDMYSLGCTFYRLVTGQNPFQRSSVKEILRAHVKDEATPAHKVDPEVPAEVGAIIDRLMAKAPEDRYQSAVELVEELEELLAPPSRKGLVMTLVAAAVLAIGGAIWYAATLEREVVEVTNPDAIKAAAAAKAQLREQTATTELLELKIKGLVGLAMAEALDELAKKHPDTVAAATATADAARIRDEVKRAAAEAERLRRQTDAELARIQAAFDAAIAAGDVQAAAAVARAGAVAAAVRSQTRIATRQTELRSELRDYAAKRVSEMQTAVTAAREQRDPTAARAALEPLRAIVAGDTAWPPEAIAERGPIEKFIELTERECKILDRQLAEQADAAAWSTLCTALVADGDVLALIDRLDFDGALSRIDALQPQLGDTDAAARLDRLRAAVEHAKGYFSTFTVTAANGGLEIPAADGERVPVQKLDMAADPPGFTVQGGDAEPEFVPLAQVRTDLPGLFVELDTDDGALQRDAFLAVVSLATHVRAAREYLDGLAEDDDQSGTGEQGFRVEDGMLRARLPALDAARERAWADLLTTELDAVRVLARALRALSARRNTTAQRAFDQLLSRHADTLVVRALR